MFHLFHGVIRQAIHLPDGLASGLIHPALAGFLF